MKVAKRREAMLEAVLGGMTDVGTLCAHFGMSEATVRRDLRALADDRLILRTYGGAAVVETHEPEATLAERVDSGRDQKDWIGRAAARHVSAGDTVFLDGGTTTAALARHLAGHADLHVVTNNLLVVSALAATDCRLTLIGGDIRPSSMSTLGPLAQLALSRITVDKAFLGADGVVAQRGLCEASAEQAYLKECVTRQAAHVFVLVTADKLGRASQQHWTPMERQWTLLTDAGATTTALSMFNRVPGVAIEVAARESRIATPPQIVQ
ncbi:DeoR faimly transcriptional regulator [Robbsia andropogonis]|uniref:DeoR faimly transcriptional regulator n=1 Tax=Robbsia andropogonis TaxID=28092 RepID=A0A0F5JWB0_9BURK|nr:DeoR/GlpR family DNA-binding transcription regulator [Robbsia andropogonis]KKB62126.1 DeoR faimly transcriptional regulator [Robbsia andropogonis]MCP1119550.1 DeoR/GlpR family DNA-binding transcription regulator [Robbsia andropogonis]MCP1129533.1 DeoR/GlpR family DNA-binding transcription regulator [Robbsia andropogonis]